tara:strand:- start:469 stop:1032 length:564 start_codon:yes stop_codon:yes gene_type:complete
VGPAGVGKNKILEAIQEKYPNLLSRSISHTTRAQRTEEINGKDYHFVTTEQFKELIENNALIEYDIHAGRYYGTSFSSLIPLLESGKDTMKIINIYGIKSLRELESFKNQKHIAIFINSPSKEESEKRLRDREDINMTEEEIQERMKIGDEEIKFYHNNQHYFNHYIINDILDETVEEIVSIIKNVK